MSVHNPFPTKPAATNKPFAKKGGRPYTALQAYANATPKREKPGNAAQTKHQHHYGKAR